MDTNRKNIIIMVAGLVVALVGAGIGLFFYLGFFKVTPTGFFGPITLQAVKDYQTAKGIAFITGFVGPLTRAELNK